MSSLFPETDDKATPNSASLTAPEETRVWRTGEVPYAEREGNPSPRRPSARKVGVCKPAEYETAAPNVWFFA